MCLGTHVVGGSGIGRLRETADPENFGSLQERAQVPLVDVYLAVVDELNQRLQVIENDVLQHDHGVFARRTLRKKKRETNVNHRFTAWSDRYRSDGLVYWSAIGEK